MSEYQIMRWREIPSMVIAREAETTIKVMLASRFQEAIDELRRDRCRCLHRRLE